ncbi:MAG: DUF6279 family lipoprotein [Wenzhouxiangella sp.]
MTRLLKSLILLLLLTALSGCGVRTAYNNLDWLTVRWVNQQVDLDRDQEAMLRDWLTEQLAWHCQTQLPLYQAVAEAIRHDLLTNNLNQARLAEHGQSVAELGRTLTERSLPLLIELAASLSDEQVAQVLEAFDERTEEVRVSVEEKSLEELAEERLESMERMLRRFMGRSNRPQRERLALWADSVTATESYQLRQRLYWQDRLGQALDQRDNQALLAGEIAALMRPESAWSDEYRQVMEGNRVLTLAALEDVIAVADNRHLNRLSSRLTGLINDFQRLRCDQDGLPTLLAGAYSG